MEPRTPRGRLSEAGKRRQHGPTEVKRLRDAALRRMADPEWGTELGRLYLCGSITEIMYVAGKKWRELAAKYRKAFEAFPVRSASVEMGRGGSDPDPESPAGRAQAKREAKTEEDFFKAHAVLVQVGGCAEMAVRQVCERDEGVCGIAELIALRNGLSALSEH